MKDQLYFYTLMVVVFLLSVNLAGCSGRSFEIKTLTTTGNSTSSESLEDEGNNKMETGGRTIIGDIEKLKRIGEILQTVGGKVIPVLVGNSQSTQNNPAGEKYIGQTLNSGTCSSEETRNRVRGLQIIHDIKKEVDDITKNNKI